jgi:hypothetical protein
MQLARLYREQGDKELSSVARHKNAETIRKYIESRDALAKREELRDDHIVKAHPGWKRIEDVLRWLMRRLAVVDRGLAEELLQRVEGL